MTHETCDMTQNKWKKAGGSPLSYYAIKPPLFPPPVSSPVEKPSPGAILQVNVNVSEWEWEWERERGRTQQRGKKPVK